MTLRRGEGRVTARYGAEFEISIDQKETIIAKGRNKHRDVVCGDFVSWKEETIDSFALVELLPRKNVLSRSGFRGQSKTLAANIDQVIIVTAPKPQPDWEVVDQLLIVAKQLNTEAFILHHKNDLPADSDMQKEWDTFRKIGYPVLETSINDSDSINTLENLLAAKTNILVGQSGVGKSSLVQEILNDAEIKIGEISKSTQLGQHTTSVTRLYSLPEKGYLIDSPGIRDFTPDNLNLDTIHNGFIEISALSSLCHFHNCQHINEPNCVVKKAVEGGEISLRRYENYLGLKCKEIIPK